ncbi:hypothetical protein J6590_053585 [Homalodisca vitripennis]|nr:hypothetical protein J6590_053585 [Homalodisca vitripennis]KAG8296617.1 hypothetical protein J6590_053585 [Homalodisca vitripennis]KAG8296618.1 hypothetical protein J6590_053585 [Homalodisca vitripennis]
MLQSLQQSASTFAGMVTQFSRRLGWSNVELLVSQFCARLQFGAQRELLDLLRLDCLTAVQARALYNGGIQGLADLATASVNKVEKYLRRATPFQSENEECEASDKCRIWLVGRCGASETEAANILIQEARQYLERELGLQSANWGNLNSVSESDSTVEESLVTQSLDTPPQPIGQVVMEADRAVSAVVHEAEVKQITATTDCLGSDEVKNVLVQSGIKPEEVNSKMINLNTSVDCNRVEEQSHLKISNGGSLRFKETVESIIVQSTASGTPKQSANISVVTVKKRGSLDIFDSPENVDNNYYYAGTNIEEKNNLLKISSYSSPKEVSLIKCIKSPLKYEHDKEILNTMNGQVSGERSKSRDLGAERLEFSPLCEDRTSASKSKNINISGMISTEESKESNKSVFFDSPVPFELKGVSRYSVGNELDANVGGENLLEISSFSVISEQSCMEENHLLDANVGGDSLLEMSSFIAETENRKRKRSIEETSVIKRLRISTPGGSEKMSDPKAKLNELQVSKITSTNSKQVTASTPTSSKYFEESINFENTFAPNEDIKNSENLVIEEKVFVKTNSNDVHTTSAYESNGYNEEDSFDLKLSEDGLSENEFGCDTDLDLDSKICDLLDCKNASSKRNVENKNSLTQNILGDSVDVDSKLGALLDLVPSTLDSQQCTMKNETPLKDHCNLNHSKENKYSNHVSFEDSVITDSYHSKVIGERKSLNMDSKEKSEHCPESKVFKNNKLICHSVVIDSELDSSINNVNVLVSDKEKVNTNTDLFTSNIVNTQICDLLDEVNGRVSNFVSENPQRVSNQFENSEFDLNTQLCNVLDRNDVIISNKENVKSDQAIWTESMEVREILDLSFDEDTVFGTPVSHQNSMSFRKCSRKNKTTKITKAIADGKTNIKMKLGEKQDPKLMLVPLKSNGQNDPELSERQKPPNLEKYNRKCLSENLSHKHQRTVDTMTSEHAIVIEEHKKPVNHKTVVKPTTLSAVEPVQISQSVNSLTDSVLEAVFASSLRPGTPVKQTEEVDISQQTPVTPRKPASESGEKPQWLELFAVVDGAAVADSLWR